MESYTFFRESLRAEVLAHHHNMVSQVLEASIGHVIFYWACNKIGHLTWADSKKKTTTLKHWQNLDGS